MKIEAKFHSKCWVCAGDIVAGQSIDWNDGGRPFRHWACKRRWPDDATVVTAGPGLRYGKLEVGMLVRHPSKGALKVFATKARQVKEGWGDYGMSGPGELTTAWCVPATPREIVEGMC